MLVNNIKCRKGKESDWVNNMDTILPMTLTFKLDFQRLLSAALVSACQYAKINFRRNTNYVIWEGKNKLCNGKEKGIPIHVYLSRLGFMQSYSGPTCLDNMYMV